MDRHRDEIPAWRLSFWNKSDSNLITPENLLSGMNIDILKGVPQSDRSFIKPFTDETYYKNYMQHLKDEIPKLRHEIDHLERKKMYIEAEKEHEEAHKGKITKADMERIRMSALMMPEELPVEEPSDNSEQDRHGQCTPELSLHGSSYADTKNPAPAAVRRESNGKRGIQQQRSIQSSATDDDGNDDEEDAGASSEAVSDLPSDKP